MTQYLVTAWNAEGLVRELWPAIGEHGQSMIAAEGYAVELYELFPCYEYTVRPVTEEQVREVTA